MWAGKPLSAGLVAADRVVADLVAAGRAAEAMATEEMVPAARAQDFMRAAEATL